MTTTWVIAADSSSAKILKADSRIGPLHEVETLLHPEGRLHEKELTSDLPGKALNSDGQGVHGIDSSTTPKKKEMIAFADRIAGHLEHEHNAGKFNQLIVVAPPAFLGNLRKQFPDPLARLVVLEIDKNIEHQTVDQIRKQLPERLPTLST